MNLGEDLFAYARKIGIDLIGVTGAEPFTTTRQILEERRRQGLYAPFAPGNLDRACNPVLNLPEARSIIAVGIVYYQGHISPPEGHRGYFSRSAWGQDYHRVVKEKLELLQDFLRREVPGSRQMAFVDTGPLVDKAVAKRAGLGWFGKNTLLLTPLGSWVFLGGILTSANLPPQVPAEKDCGNCDLCLAACPTGALIAPGILDPERCLSYLTQKKGYLPWELRPYLGCRIYGCDTCQEVCPYNRAGPITKEEKFLPRGQEHQPLLVQFLEMNNKEFKATYGASSAAWRGRTVLQRNALVAVGNLCDPDMIPLLENCLRDPRPIIRGHAAWALGRLGTERGRRILERSLASEGDPQVQREICFALTGKE